MHSNSKTISVSWCQGPENWAFKNLCEHLRKQMPAHKHKINEPKADVLFLVSPSQLDKFSDKKNIIQHVDSNRWYEQRNLAK